jgi:hypothetical protein
MPSSSESILDHIAEYLNFISDAQLFWLRSIRAMTPEPIANAIAKTMAEGKTNATVEVTAEATAKAMAEVTEGGGMARVNATNIWTRGGRGAR